MLPGALSQFLMETFFCGITGFGFLWLARCSHVRTHQDTPRWWLPTVGSSTWLQREIVGGGGWWSCLSCARGWMGVWGGLVNPALEDAKRKTLQPSATSFCTKMKSRREEGRGARDMTNQPLRVSPFLSHYYHNPPSRLVRGRREEQGKGSAEDVGWHIRNLLELDIWAGPWRGSTELLILQSFKIWISHTQKITSVWGRGMFSQPLLVRQIGKWGGCVKLLQWTV